MKTKLAVLLATVLAMNAAAENLIKNGDFSRADSKGMAADFVPGKGNDVYTVPQLEIIEENGLSYLQVKLEEDAKARFRPERSLIPVKKGITYVMNIRVRGSGKVMLTSRFLGKGSPPELFGKTSWQETSEEWEDLSFKWKAPRNGNVRLMLQVRGSIDVDEWFLGEKE